MLCGLAVTQKKVILNSNGKAWRPHIYIEDVCEAFRCCIEWNYDDGKLLVLNVGRNDNNWRIIDIAKLVQKEVKGCQLEFISKSLDCESNNILKDRNIKDGVDKRTYKVNFTRIHNQLPNFNAKWDVETGLKQLIQDLERWELEEVKFKQRDFYRLRQLEHLYSTGQSKEHHFSI